MVLTPLTPMKIKTYIHNKGEYTLTLQLIQFSRIVLKLLIQIHMPFGSFNKKEYNKNITAVLKSEFAQTPSCQKQQNTFFFVFTSKHRDTKHKIMTRD